MAIILENGSLQSHQYGKKIVNSIKKCVNHRILDKCCCCCSKRIPSIDLNDMDEIRKYNSDLAVGLSIHFIVSASSSLIMMVYFGMLRGSLNAKIDNKVFEFMAVSFGIDCMIIFGQILVFKKRAREYFIKMKVSQHICHKYGSVISILNLFCGNDRQFIVENYQLDDGYVWIDIVYYSLLLAWFWIGGVTGAPVDVSI